MTSIYEKYNDMSPDKSSSGKLISQNLFSLSLASTDQKVNTTLLGSVDTITNIFNEKYTCSLTSDQVSSVLYATNTNFKKEIDITALSNHDLATKGLLKNLGKACQTFLVCKYSNIQKYKNYILSQKAIDKCSHEINSLYDEVALDHSLSTSLEKEKFGDEVFWNNNLKDSKYDIMYDVSVLGELLFNGFDKPQELIYYQMADTSFPSKSSAPILPNKRDLFNKDREKDNNDKQKLLDNLYKKRENNRNKKEKSHTKVSSLGNNNQPQSNNTMKKNNQDNIDNNENSGLVLGNILSLKDSDTILGNVCEYPDNKNISTNKEDNFPKEPSVKQMEKMTEEIKKYINTLSENMAKQQCIPDGVCDTNESYPCSDCTKDGKTVIPKKSKGDVGNKRTHKPGDGYNKNGGGNPINNISDIGDLENVKSCVKSCNGFSNPSDKFMCIMRCTCNTINSPFWQGIPDLTNIFRVKICLVPPKDRSIPKEKKAYSIEEIIGYTVDTLWKTSNSGMLNVQNKSRETNHTQNEAQDVSKQSRFTFSIEQGKLRNHDNPRTKKEKAENKNIANKKFILGISENLENESDRNHYTLVFNKAKSQAKESGFTSLEEKEIIEQKYKRMYSNSPTKNESKLFDEQTFSAIQMQNFDKFLQENIIFWSDSKVIFEEFKQTAEVLKNK